MWLHAFGNGALVPTVCVQEIITTYINLHDGGKKKKKAARVYGFSRESDGRGDGRVEVGCLDLSLSSSEKAGSFCEERRRSVKK